MKFCKLRIQLGIVFCLALLFLLALYRMMTVTPQFRTADDRQGDADANALVVGDCPQVDGPVEVTETQTFQKVGGSPDLSVFSAFLMDEPQNIVRVMAIGEGKKVVGIFCQLWYRQPPREEEQRGVKLKGAVPEMRLVPGTYKALPESHDYRYTAAYITCKLPSSPEYKRPYAVSVTRTDCRQTAGGAPENVLLVLPPAARTPQRNFTVCIPALHDWNSRSRVYELVEMLELNRILGAQLFTFYVHSMSDNVRKILAWYERQGLVQLIQWNLPPLEIHYYGQLASHNDCLNRHRGASRYLVFVDMDEFIIPKQHYNWTRMMEHFEKQSPSSDYLFRCQCFQKELRNNTDQFPGHELAAKFQSVSLSAVMRDTKLYSYTERPKLIIKPENIDIMGIHNIWTYRKSPTSLKVREEVAALYHYWYWCKPENASASVSVRDTSMYAYSEDLLARLQDVWSHFPDLLLDNDITN